MSKHNILACFRVGGSAEAKDNTVNEFIYYYQLITCSGHPNASKNQVTFCCVGVHGSPPPPELPA